MRSYSRRMLIVFSMFVLEQVCVIFYISTLKVDNTYNSKVHITETVKKASSRGLIDTYTIPFHEPFVEEDFPTVESTTPLIPHIIHQTYKDVYIPQQFVKNIQSLVEKNNNWTYFFWTDGSARKLVAERYPQLIHIWDEYKTPMQRADVIRYIALYEFGGFYGDLDVECIRPLDRLTTKYTCIFPPEPFEQSAFRARVPYLLNNAIMLCRPKHPFLKYMIDSVHQYQVMLELVDSTGPTFVTSQFIRYNNIAPEEIYRLKETSESNSPYFYKGRLPENDVNAVYIPNTQYFIYTLSVDGFNVTHYKHICNRGGLLSQVQIRACHELQRRLSQRHPNKFAFTDHKWFKSYQHRDQLMGKAIPITHIVTKGLQIY